MESRVDLDLAVGLISRHAIAWEESGLAAGALTWGDAAGPWPCPLREDRSQVTEPDSAGVTVRKGEQQGRLVVFRGGWADLEYWSGGSSDGQVTRYLAGTTGWTFLVSSGCYGGSLTCLARARTSFMSDGCGPSIWVGNLLRSARSVNAGKCLTWRGGAILGDRKRAAGPPRCVLCEAASGAGDVDDRKFRYGAAAYFPMPTPGGGERLR
jgi:hypothetical protein